MNMPKTYKMLELCHNLDGCREAYPVCLSKDVRDMIEAEKKLKSIWVYTVEREGGDGLEVDIFTDRTLAEKWAAHIGGRCREEHTIDEATLKMMMEEDESVYINNSEQV